MGRPIQKKYFGNTNLPPIGGEGLASFTVGGTNNNYTTKPTISSIGAPNLPGGVQAVGTISTMVAKTATVGTSGTGTVTADYVPGNILTVLGGTSTSAATFTVSSVNVRTAAVQAGGTTVWTTGDTVTFSATGWATPAVLTITATAGAITSLSVTTPGSWTTSGSVPTDPVAPDSATVADGGGYQNDATFNLGFGVNAVTVLAAGSYTVLPTNPVSTSTNSVNGTGATLNVNYGIGTATVTTAGSGYTTAPSVTLSGGNGTLTAVLTNVNQNAIKITAYVPGGSSGVNGDIVKQEASRRYLVTTAQGTGQCRLVAASPSAGGEMTIVATDSSGKTYYVTKLTAHKALLTQFGAAGHEFATGSSVQWSMAAPVLNTRVQVENQ